MTKETKLEPLGDSILVKEIADEAREEKTKSGIIIPVTVATEKGNAKRGMVISVGPGKITDEGKKIPVSVKKGEVILFQWGDEVVMNGVKYFLVREESVLAVIK